MKDGYSIAIDGPSGVGKSTIAKCISKVLNLTYIDTGAMYRAVALKIKEKDIDFNEDKEIEKLLEETDIDFKQGSIYLDGKNVESLIRSEDISKLSSIISKNKLVRDKMVYIQRNLAKSKSTIMEGRDIGTVVLPDAKYKFYLTASVEDRANRRYKQLLEAGQDVNLDDIKSEITLRDYNDMNREHSPLKKALDAVELDNSGMTVEESSQAIIKYIKEDINDI